MNTKIRRAINKDLGKLLKPIYFEEIPLYGMFDIIDNHGYTVVDEEGNPWTGFLCGREATVAFDIIHKVLKTPVKPRLILQWYKMPSGRYEITAYVS